MLRLSLKENFMRRPRRNRKSQNIRSLVAETHLNKEDFIYPVFVVEGTKQEIPVKSMPGISRYSKDLLIKELAECMELGIQNFCVFPGLPESKKNKESSEALNPEGLYLSTLREIKKEFPECSLMTDVALDPYSVDGHDGIVENGEIINDATVDLLAKISVMQAEAGADIIGPSDMMDARVGAIRAALDDEGYTNTSIMSYSVKYASSFYGPFRDALDSAPKDGDKKTYQMDPANRTEALLEAELDVEEGADFLMVKPALSYLDVISDLKANFPLPIAAYNVSGEYAMVKAMDKMGWGDGRALALETLLSIKRAGADIILSYFAKELAKELR
ncbi:MAG: porphobilinogen synthase [Bdellovibrionaceae bacterium]|nr:porphobilinogen synthase [Pseudobdellovibrionaceae bacterium]|tara:strand:- start:21120 stop:22115 length:996 start_codon:yes stop_codon:yes gene_type:complete